MNLKIIKNPDDKIYKEVSAAVKNNDGYCPCLLEISTDTKCICRDFNEQEHSGPCHCGRFIKIIAD